MSEAVAVILIATYGFSLLFTLRTHRRLFGGEAHPMDGPVWAPGKAILVLALATVGVAIESEILVHAATEATETLGLLDRVPRPHHHPDHRQRGRARGRGHAVAGRDRSTSASRSRSARAPRSRCWWRPSWCSRACCSART